MIRNQKAVRRIQKATKPTSEFAYGWDEGSANMGLKFKVPHRNKAAAYRHFVDRVTIQTGMNHQQLGLKDPAKVKNRDFKGMRTISVNTNPHNVEDFDYVYPRDFNRMEDVKVTFGKKNNPVTGERRKTRAQRRTQK